ncbi:hypothetical protein EJ06DRAFT_143804 [Trichodelitschia bisporula]|uniref:Uncharacterized protein n=1 Tax=Trichodelitschia bisporula TaxID=703511 RepID=A0A6G1HML0_9PEZI|nr:hypothetical protein EJ06DRAFT_143804 [Trichodelitschia bisporula]
MSCYPERQAWHGEHRSVNLTELLYRLAVGSELTIHHQETTPVSWLHSSHPRLPPQIQQVAWYVSRLLVYRIQLTAKGSLGVMRNQSDGKV